MTEDHIISNFSRELTDRHFETGIKTEPFDLKKPNGKKQSDLDIERTEGKDKPEITVHAANIEYESPERHKPTIIEPGPAHKVDPRGLDQGEG